MAYLGLCKRKEIWVPTLRGWGVMIICALVVGVSFVKGLVPFLGPSKPQNRGILVVEGWLPDYAFAQAKSIFDARGYRLIVVTGVPIDQGIHLTQATNYAELGASALRHLGVPADRIVSVATPDVAKDRTFSTARQFRRWLEDQKLGDDIDIITLGVHSRRTWLLYDLVLRDRWHCGIIAAEDRRYNPDRWWTTSSGFRVVTSEAIAYCYAKLLFYPTETSDPLSK